MKTKMMTTATALALLVGSGHAHASDMARTATLNMTSARSAMPLPRLRPDSARAVVYQTAVKIPVPRARPVPIEAVYATTMGEPASVPSIEPASLTVASADTEYLVPAGVEAHSPPIQSGPAYTATYAERAAPLAVGYAEPSYSAPVYAEPVYNEPVGVVAPVANYGATTVYSEPEPLDDKRIRELFYDPAEVYEIDGYMGFVTTISFGERVTAITIGDPSAWDVKPLGDKKIVSIKPINASSRTNMVVTGKSGRIFTFRLVGHEHSAGVPDTQITYRVAFDAPPKVQTFAGTLGGNGVIPASARGVKATDLNFDYTARGDELLTPIRAFDDGVKTYFQFPENTRAPAMFTVDSEGSESTVNYTVNGQYFVVQGTAKQFTLRDGSTATCIYNKSHPGPKGRDDGSPLIEGATRSLAV